jgi:hypothetical protein
VAERPILFSGPMVPAILDGRKTQTRRVIKPQPPVGTRGVYRPFGGELNNWQGARGDLIAWYGQCPHGQEGDRLWVRETFTVQPQSAISSRDLVFYRADVGNTYLDGKWKPSIFMPRWANRILLDVAEVRAQRLQEISEADAAEEGVGAWFEDHPHPEWDGDPNEYRKGFQELWDAINGNNHPWSKNPWVWAVTFKKIG